MTKTKPKLSLEDKVREFVEQCNASGKDARIYARSLAGALRASEQDVVDMINAAGPRAADQGKIDDYCNTVGRTESAAREREFDRREARQ